MTSAQLKTFFLQRYDEVLLSPTWIKVALGLLLLTLVF
jgi:hypothetical protein